MKSNQSIQSMNADLESFPRTATDKFAVLSCKYLYVSNRNIQIIDIKKLMV